MTQAQADRLARLVAILVRHRYLVLADIPVLCGLLLNRGDR